MFESEDIVRSANMYLVAKDKNFRYLYCNENVVCALDLDSPKKIIGKTDYELFSDDIASMFRAGDTHVLRGGSLLNVREVHPHTNKLIKILTTKNQLKNKQGSLRGVVVSFIDITGLECKLSSDVLKYDHQKNPINFLLVKRVNTSVERNIMFLNIF